MHVSTPSRITRELEAKGILGADVRWGDGDKLIIMLPAGLAVEQWLVIAGMKMTLDALGINYECNDQFS